MNPHIFHLTHIGNLPAILSEGGLWSNNHRPASTGAPISSAHANIQARRAATRVPCGPGGVLHDYVPFYFGARSPMLYANHTGYAGSGGQRPLIYLVSDVHRVVEAGCRWVFTDGHAEMLRGLSRAYDDVDALADLDWKAVGSRYWASDPEARRKKQAEFLVHRFLPWSLMLGVAVIDPGTQADVRSLVVGQAHAPPVAIRPSWYY